MNFPHYHEDIAHLHVNTLPNRAYFIPMLLVKPLWAVSVRSPPE